MIDRSKEKFLLTFYPSGYLKKVKSESVSKSPQAPLSARHEASLVRPQQSTREAGQLVRADAAAW